MYALRAYINQTHIYIYIYIYMKKEKLHFIILNYTVNYTLHAKLFE